MQQWFNLLETMQPGSAQAMQIDYDIYADGEAMLGWLNATVQIDSKNELDATDLLTALGTSMPMRRMRSRCARAASGQAAAAPPRSVMKSRRRMLPPG